MIEAITATAFLASSMYGAGHVNAQTAGAADAWVKPEQAITRTVDTKQVEAYVRKEFSNTPILVEVARCESAFRQYDEKGQVIRGIVNSADVGVFQINEKYHSEAAVRLGNDIYTMEGNVAFAKYLYKKYGASPWSSSKPCWGTGDLAQK